MMKPHTLVLTGLAALLLACADEPVVYAELEEICGAPGPFRVLELEPDEVLRYSEPVRVQDRVFHIIGRTDPAGKSPYSLTEASTVWTTGPCGESPARLASGIDDIFVLDALPDLVLGCETATGDVLVLDPTGARPPHVAFSPNMPGAYGCALRWSDFGALSVEAHDEQTGALLLHPFPDDPRGEPSSPVVLLDPIRLLPDRQVSGFGYIDGLVHAFPDHALALTPEQTLVRVDLADRSVTTVQTGVEAFTASRDGRYLLWQDATVTGDDPMYPEGKILLRDRDVGSDILLAETSLRYNNSFALAQIEHGVVTLDLGKYINSTKRIFSLPTLAFVDVPATLYLNARLADGRWIGSLIFDNLIELIELSTSERTRLFPRKGYFLGIDDDAIRVLEASDDREGPLWRVPIDGSAPTKLAERATPYMTHLDDGRLLGTVGVGSRWLGALVLVDTHSRAETRVDDRVHGHWHDASRVNDEGIVTYSVRDGDRSGVYVARLPAAP